MKVFDSALSLVIYKNGKVQEQDIDDLLVRYREKKGIVIEKEIYCKAVDAATRFFNRNEQCVFVCTAAACLKKAYLHPSEDNMQRLSEDLGCAVTVTGCHYQCESGPTITLKTGEDSEPFLDICSEEKWLQARNAIRRKLNHHALA